MSASPVPSAADIELAFLDKFFLGKDLEPYPVQEKAFEHIFKGENLLVTVPTGTGKTMVAKAALFRALSMGRTAIYTTPLRALTEEKYRELCDDFGADKVGFATGDYKVNPEAPIQVVVAEILWNRLFAVQGRPADIVVMDEGHYFNDPERGYVWEQSIIALPPQVQLIVLSATIGNPKQFCTWIYSVRKVEMQLVESLERRVPLHHEYHESYLIEVVKNLHFAGDTPAIIFVFGRDQCFEWARLLKSCPRFVTDAERAIIEERVDKTLLPGGISKDLRSTLLHGVGIHHAGILPRYKRLVEELTVERLLKFVVSTETIAAGLNLPAKRVIFPSLRKMIKGQARLLTSAEYHQMAGRAGRPQFDPEGIALVLAPEEYVQEVRKELKDAGKKGALVDEARIRRAIWSKISGAAKSKGEILWDKDAQMALASGTPAALKSQTKITPEMVLTIGLPDLSQGDPPPDLHPWENLNAVTITDHLLLSEYDRMDARKKLKQIVDNLRALDVVDEHGRQVRGELIGKIRGLDGLFVYYMMMSTDVTAERCAELVEFLVDHNVIHKLLGKKDEDKRRAWIQERLREKRKEQPQTSWEDVEEEYDREFPRVLTKTEEIHGEFLSRVPHPEIHGGKVQKGVWAMMVEQNLDFFDLVERHDLQREEGSLFTYLARLMKAAKMLHEATTLSEFKDLEDAIRRPLARVDERVLTEF